MSVQWTEDQKKVIELRNRNILVSAGCRQALDRDIYRSGSSGNERANPGCH